MDISDNQSHGCPKRKRESGRKRGELQSGSAATPARPAPFADGRGKFKRRSDRFGKKTCACLGRPARSAGCPGAATAATGHRRRPTCIKTSTRLTLNCQILSGLTACFSFRGFGLLSVCLWINLVGICAVGELLL